MEEKKKLTIFEVCQKVDNEIKSDFGGGSPVPKTFLMSYLVSNQKLKNYVEIGVYRGKSLFSTAYSVHLNGGISYGIDPYSADCAKEYDVEQSLKIKIDNFVETTDFDSIYTDVLHYREKCGYGKSICIIREPSEKAISFFVNEKIKPDLLHIDGNHDTQFVKRDFELYYEIMENGSFIVFDDINWDSVRGVYEQAKEKCYCIFESEYFGVLMKADASITSQITAEKLSKKLSAVFSRVENMKASDELPLVTVGVLTYNHEAYVEEALNSVLEQHGDFRLHVVISDDNSEDSTANIVESVIARTPQHDGLKIEFHRNEKNVGVVENFHRLINMIKETHCDYFSFCEGDDYYLTSNRLAKHLDFCERNPQLALSYNKLIMYWQNEQRFEVYNSGYEEPVLPTEELVKFNHIGNLNASFIRGTVLQEIHDDLFEGMFTGDWMFHIFCSQYGDVGFVKMPYNVYRKHSSGVWACNDDIKKLTVLLKEIQGYNRYLNFTYEAEFHQTWNALFGELKCRGKKYPDNISIAVIDDIFPHPLSGFRYQEFTSILKSVPNSVVFSTGESIKVLNNCTFDELLIEYKRKYPEISDRVFRYNNDCYFNAKLLYCTFLGNAWGKVVNLAEQKQIPFVFTLYPGGAFEIGTRDGDKKLKRVFRSPWFYKVIVTQDITYNYLIDNGFCRDDQIVRIFGVVIPLEKLEMQIQGKKHYGIDKDTLDICFVAHKYTKYGQDKGYDIFIEVAKELSKKYDHIHFHVVGPWDEQVINIAGIRHITFYGSQNQEWFDNFYADKDIILSPNIDGKIFKGSFDGFPTGCVTDAALRDVAMFITDPLSLNNGRFVDGQEIVIIKHNKEDILKRIVYYLNEPEKLKALCENGHRKVKELYSYEIQIAPRIKLLSEAVEADFEPQHTVRAAPETSPYELSLPLWAKVYQKYVPKPVKYIYRTFKFLCITFYREFVPNILKRIYRKIKQLIKYAIAIVRLKCLLQE